MYENIKSFLAKLDIFINDLKTRIMKYFPCLQKHFQDSQNFENYIDTKENAISKYLLILEEIKLAFLERFNQFKQLETTLQFLVSPHKIEFKNLELSFFDWLDIGDLEMELAEFQNSFVWRNKFEELNLTLEKRACGIITEKKSVEERIENIILQEWNSLPNTFNAMKKIANALLTIFGSTYTCEQLFSSMNFIKSAERNRLSKEMTAACVRLKATNYAPQIEKLSSNKQQQISH